MGNRSECPVCKAGISEENVIPVYARGTDAVDSRYVHMIWFKLFLSECVCRTHDGIPERPRGQRLDAHSLYYRRLNNVCSSYHTIGYNINLSFIASNVGWITQCFHFFSNARIFSCILWWWISSVFYTSFSWYPSNTTRTTTTNATSLSVSTLTHHWKSRSPVFTHILTVLIIKERIIFLI